jgi:serine O-acetyltransferase
MTAAMTCAERPLEDCSQRTSQAARLWSVLRTAAGTVAEAEPELATLMNRAVLDHGCLGEALAFRLAEKLADADFAESALRRLICEAFVREPALLDLIGDDLTAGVDRNPAVDDPLEPFLYFKGFLGLVTYRVSHWLWQQERRHTALQLQSRASEVFAMDIHPAARIGRGVFVDHATGLVIGETAVVGDDVSILQQVTLGGTGKEAGDRHPKVGDGVLIGAGATILGNIAVGKGAKIGAGSVVLHPVPACTTVAGVPARVVRFGGVREPARLMDHSIPFDDDA